MQLKIAHAIFDMKIFIPPTSVTTSNQRRALFILTRPFLNDGHWDNVPATKKRWDTSADFCYTHTIEEADVYFIPKPIDSYSTQALEAINTLCKAHNIKGYGYISGDYGQAHPEFSELTYFRLGGFRSQLSENYRGLPVVNSDRVRIHYNSSEIEVRTKGEKPVVGFCGYAHASLKNQMRWSSRFLYENTKRFLQNPRRKDYEPLFSAPNERAYLMRRLEQSERVTTHFIYRKEYRAGATTEASRKKTTAEYYENIIQSDYVLCVRGAGNFSIRLYETLMMGRIPIFVDTDCLLPFPEHIDWKKYMIWVPWKNRKNIADIVADFHAKLTDEEFKTLQKQCRKLWKEQLSVGQMLRYIRSEQE